MTLSKIAATVCLSIVAGSMLPGIAKAESLAEKKKHKEQLEYFQKEVDYTNEKCGIKLNASIDWTGSKLEDFDTYSAYGYCEAGLDALEAICADDDGKTAVRDKVKTYICKFGKREVGFKDGTLTFTAEWEAANNSDYVKDYLMNAL
jgi:hypothetical protein